MITPISFIQQAAALAAWRKFGLTIPDAELRHLADDYDDQPEPRLAFGQCRIIVPYILDNAGTVDTEKTLIALLYAIHQSSPHYLQEQTIRSLKLLLAISPVTLRNGVTRPQQHFRIETIDLYPDKPVTQLPQSIESELLPSAGVLAAMAYDRTLVSAMAAGRVAVSGFWLPAYQMQKIRTSLVPYVGFRLGERELYLGASEPHARARVRKMSIPQLIT